MAGAITPFLWFDGQAEDAANFYVEVFGDGEITDVVRYPEGAPGPTGSVMTMAFRLRNQHFTALNGGPQHRFSPATSFVIECGSQDEVDHFWERLSEGGEPSMCGWLTDKFGVTWQVVPDRLLELMRHEDPAAAQRVVQAMLTMQKIEIAPLEAAAAES